MKLLLPLCILFAVPTFAQESKPEGAIESTIKSAKKERKKKVEMCHECGKPEVNCDCKGEGHKKGE